MRVLVTGSADGLGRLAAASLLDAGHDVVVHVRAPRRVDAVADLLRRGAHAVVGDLSDVDQVRGLAAQLNALGRMDSVVHNAGVESGAAVMPVNVVAPYLLTACTLRPDRLVYLSSSMHFGGRPVLSGIDWSGRTASGSYSDSKLLVTVLSAAVARLWPDVFTGAVDPGWVPTRMGGPGAPDDLRLGHLTQEWLATTTDVDALSTGGYWHHQRRVPAHSSVGDSRLADRLLDALGAFTGTYLAVPPAPTS